MIRHQFSIFVHLMSFIRLSDLQPYRQGICMLPKSQRDRIWVFKLYLLSGVFDGTVSDVGQHSYSADLS